MGIDPTRLLNHTIHHTNAHELVQRAAEKTGIPVVVFSLDEKTPDCTGYWHIYTEEGLSLDDHLTNGDLVTLMRSNEKFEEESMDVSEHVMEYYTEDFYMGRWFQIKHWADSIREYGIFDATNIMGNVHPASWQFESRKKLYEHCKKLGTSAMVIFCDDQHQEWLDYFTLKKWTLEQFVEWGRVNFIFVRFQDLIHFKFPDKAPDYYNVFIYDDFEDLKP